jgi:glycosyltransferase involved in cell wall biosynthesis
MSKLRPRFSIVIPCYNEANFISDTLKSLQKQEIDESVELVVVDNNCTDNTIEIAKKFGARIIKEDRSGVCWARQSGTVAARGDIIVSTDADMKFAKDWLSKIDKSFKDNKEIVAVGGPCRYFNGPWWRSYTYFLFSGSYLYYLIIGHPFYITATNIAFKKSAFVKYNVNLMQGGDELDLLHNLRKKGKVQFNLANPTYTSGRRLTRGLTYNIFVTFCYYYFGAYFINRMFGRSVIGSAPAFRKKGTSRLTSAVGYLFAGVGIIVAILSISIAPVRGFMSDQFYDAAIAVKNEIKANI